MANLNSSILNGHNQNVQDVNKVNAVEVKNTPVQAMLDKHLEK